MKFSLSRFSDKRTIYMVFYFHFYVSSVLVDKAARNDASTLACGYDVCPSSWQGNGLSRHGYYNSLCLQAEYASH